MAFVLLWITQTYLKNNKMQRPILPNQNPLINHATTRLATVAGYFDFFFYVSYVCTSVNKILKAIFFKFFFNYLHVRAK